MTKIWTTVPAGVADWPKRPTSPFSNQCPRCGALAPATTTGVAAHTQQGDEDRPNKRICFG